MMVIFEIMHKGYVKTEEEKTTVTKYFNKVLL